MIRIVNKLLNDGVKRKILSDKGHQCECTYGHNPQCTRGVTIQSCFLTNAPKGEWFSYERVRVLCRPCMDKGHHRHLSFPPSEIEQPEDSLESVWSPDSLDIEE